MSEQFRNELCALVDAQHAAVQRQMIILRVTPLHIIDGNYGSTMEWRMRACDTVIFLDYPLELCLDGISKRLGKPRSDMPWTEPEEYDEKFIEFIKNYHSQSRPQVMKLLEKYSYKNTIIFKTRNEADRFLSQL